MKIYAMGGFGCGNLGDDAIFEGMRTTYPNLVQIYVNFPTVKENINYSTIIENGFPKDAEKGELIIGGGGIFHSRSAIENFLEVINKAKERKMKISIRRVGAEYIQSDYEDISKELCKTAYFISVRSKKSAEILLKMGYKTEIEHDYAYDVPLPDKGSTLPDFSEKTIPNSKIKMPIIGIVTAGTDLPKIAKLVEILTVDLGIGPHMCNVVHVPHTRHHTDWRTNDVLGGEILRSTIHLYHGDRTKRFRQLPYPETPTNILSIYKSLDGVIGMRYHSFIFSEMVGIPLFGVASGLKAITYFKEKSPKNSVWLDAGAEMNEYVEKLFIWLKKIKPLHSPAIYEVWNQYVEGWKGAS